LLADHHALNRSEPYLYEALKAGACGYLLKTVADRDLARACRAAMRGERFLYHGAMTPLIRDLLHGARNEQELREDPLVISEKTVDRHHDRVELTRYAIRRGLIEP
jgi:hypothetical protein